MIFFIPSNLLYLNLLRFLVIRSLNFYAHLYICLTALTIEQASALMWALYQCQIWTIKELIQLTLNTSATVVMNLSFLPL